MNDKTDEGVKEAPFEFSAPLTVCVDLKIPQCFLALAPTIDLAIELGIAVDWQPVTVAPLVQPPVAGAHDERGTRHRHIRAGYEADDLARYARARGLTIVNPYRDVDTSLAAMALTYLKGQAGGDGVVAEFLTGLFTRFWADEMDAEDVAVMSSLLSGVGGDGTGFEAYVSSEGREAYDAQQAGLQSAGVFIAPTYVVDDELFVGRQHLPMIGWLLTDKAGPAPA